MRNIEDYVLYYEYKSIFDLEGMLQMESTFGKNEIKLKIGEHLDLPFYEENKSFIQEILELDNKLVIILNIPCKPLWENDGIKVIIKEDTEVNYYYGRTTLNTQTDYYFKFKIKNKN